MIVAVAGRSCFVNSCRINHFGMNPVSGGSPPSDNITKVAIAARIGLFGQVVVRVLIFVADNTFKVRNAADVIKIYVPKAIRVSCGAYWITIIIHPMWAIDE